MIKKLVLLLLAVVAVYGAALSPFCLPNTLSTKAELEDVLMRKDAAASQMGDAQTTLANAINAFDSNRQFDTAYSDIGRIHQFLKQIQGVDVVSMCEADPNMDWAKGMEINIEDYAPISETESAAGLTPPPAVCMTLAVEDIPQGLSLIDKFALPVCKITTTAPGTIEVTFLTGGVS